jgi:hypothetical protein
MKNREDQLGATITVLLILFAPMLEAKWLLTVSGFSLIGLMLIYRKRLKERMAWMAGASFVIAILVAIGIQRLLR